MNAPTPGPSASADDTGSVTVGSTPNAGARPLDAPVPSSPRVATPSEAPRPEALVRQPAAAPTAQQPAVAVPAAGPAKVSKKNVVSRRTLSGRKQRFEARRVHRIIRHVDPWSVLKLSLVFFLCVWVMFMVAIIIVWSIAESSGTIGKIEDLLAELDITNSGFDGTFIFRQYGLFGLVMVFASTIATTIGSIVFNLVSDLIGGIWVTVIEEETARPTAD